VQSLQRDLDRYDIRVLQVPMDIPEPRSSDVQEIAREKVLFAYKKLESPVVALDAGFYIYSLNGFPRAFVNFALETIDLDGILRLVDGKDRNCEFRECLAYVDNSLKEPKYFVSHVRGVLSDEIKGEMQEHLWSKLGLIFIPEGSQKTLAEMSYEEYLEWRKIFREKESPSRLFSEWFDKNKM
jgi:non-canonical purine NTP pyrophosphatase (RdgB/HAM1 family)